MRISRQTAKGTAYSASFSGQPTPEQLEALDAIADAARNRMGAPPGPESVLEVPPSTACKHGRLSCKVCGTSDRRDVVHTTWGGAGKVARLRRSTKP